MQLRSITAAFGVAAISLFLAAGTAEAQGTEGTDPKAVPADKPADPPADTAATTPAPKKEPGELVLPGVGKLTVGGSIRVRGEYRGPVSYAPFTAPAGTIPDESRDSSVILERTRLWLNLAINERVNARVEFQDARTWGTEGGVTGNLGGFDLFQGYFEVSEVLNQPLTLKMGRFAIPRFGDQRIMSDLDWHNYGRVFDGAHAVYGAGAIKVHALGALLTEASSVGAFPNNYADDDHWFTGAVVEYRPKDSQFKGDFYLFGRFSESRTTRSERDVAPPAAATLPTDWWRQGTMGAWLKYAMSPFVFTLEGYNQFGRQGRDDIWAYAWAANIQMKLTDQIGLLGEYNFASGDKRPTDSKINTFDPLFPFAHAYNGHIDVQNWRNVHVVKGGTKIGLDLVHGGWKGWNLHVDVMGFWLANRRDAWYGLGGAQRADPTRTIAGSGQVGSEVDIYVKGKLADAIGVWIGYSHFFPGRYVRHTEAKSLVPGGTASTDRDMNWFFVQLVTKF